MFNLNDTMRYFLCPGWTNMRKGISSLCGVVHEKMNSEVKIYETCTKELSCSFEVISRYRPKHVHNIPDRTFIKVVAQSVI